MVGPGIDRLIAEVRLAVRGLAARPGWTAAAVLCVAIATGANAAAFTLVNGLLNRSLPFDRPDELVMVALQSPGVSSPRPFSLDEYRRLADRSSPAAALLARTFFPLSLSAADGPRMAQAELVSGNYFETLGVRPFRGSFFDGTADRPAAVSPAVLSHRLWQVRFGSSEALIGQPARVNGRLVTISGVAPPGFVGAMQLVAADLWLPAAMYPDLAGSVEAGTAPMFGVMGRLGLGIAPDEAARRLTAAMAQAVESSTAPAVIVRSAAGFGVPIALAGTVVTVSRVIYVMMALLTLVACANVAALVLARGTDRAREMAIRLSLGARSTQVAGHLLAETALLAVGGGAAGILVAFWLTQALVTGLTTPFEYVTYAFDVRPDLRVAAYSVASIVAVAVLCALAPLSLARRVDVTEVLKRVGVDGRAGRSSRSFHTLVTMQFAVSTTLLVAAGVLARSYLENRAVPRFATSDVVAVTLDLSQARVDAPVRAQLHEQAIERLVGLPGVASGSVTTDLPWRPGRTAAVLTSATPGDGAVQAQIRSVGPRYFDTLGLQVRLGQGLGDRSDARGSVVISEAAARQLWPEGSPLGRTLSLTGAQPQLLDVIGVVEDSTRQPTPPLEIYQSLPSPSPARLTVLLRTEGDPRALVPVIRATVRELHEDLSVVGLGTVAALMAEQDGQRRLPALLLTVVGGLALALSAVGLSGVMAYRVRRRRRELGIRLALGARPSDLRWLILRQGLLVVGVGAVTGIVGTLILGQLVRHAVFGLHAVEAATLVPVCAVLLTTAAIALYFPARVASRQNPVRTLRGD